MKKIDLISILLHPLMNKRGEVDGGGGGDGDGAGGDVNQQLSDLQSQFKTVSGELETSKAAKTDLEQRLRDADEELLSDDYLEFKDLKGRGSSSASGGKGEPNPLDDIDLDRASNREIAQFIEKKYKGDLEGAVGAIRKELDLSKQQLGMIAAQFDVALTSLRHNGSDGKPSFESNKDAIFKVAKANPKWDAEKCYKQFVLESKAQSDQDSETKRKKDEAEAKAATERAGVSPSVTSGKQVSKEEAADLAYRKAFGNSS